LSPPLSPTAGVFTFLQSFSPLDNRLLVILCWSEKRICSKCQYGVHFSLLLQSLVLARQLCTLCFMLSDSILMARGTSTRRLSSCPLCLVCRAVQLVRSPKQTNKQPSQSPQSTVTTPA
jgi:hypothetical protein